MSRFSRLQSYNLTVIIMRQKVTDRHTKYQRLYSLGAESIDLYSSGLPKSWAARSTERSKRTP